MHNVFFEPQLHLCIPADTWTTDELNLGIVFLKYYTKVKCCFKYEAIF